MDELENMMHMDQSLQAWFQSWIQNVHGGLNKNIISSMPVSNTARYDPIFLSGSSIEVGAICRCLSGEEIDLEFDVMRELGEINNREMGDKYLLPVSNFVGYYHLRCCPDGSFLYPYFQNLFSLDRVDLKDILMQPSSNIVDTKALKDNFLSCGNETTLQVTGPSVARFRDLMNELHFNEYYPILYSMIGMEAGIISWDNVLCISLKFLPDIMADWMNEDGDHYWPNADTCSIIRKRGVHIVAKDLQSTPSTWRISTSAAETVLFKSLTVFHKQAYMAFKILFYGYLKKEKYSWVVNEERNDFPSYLVKTVLFHYVYSKDESFWKDTVEHLVLATRELLMMLRACLEQRYCENFFIPNLNIMNWDYIPVGTLKEAAEQCLLLANDPLAFVMEKTATFRGKKLLPALIHTLTKQPSDATLIRHNIDLPSEASASCKNDLEHFVNGITHLYFYCNWVSFPVPTMAELQKIRDVRKVFSARLYQHLTSGRSYRCSRIEKLVIQVGKRLPGRPMYNWKGFEKFAAYQQQGNEAKKMWVYKQEYLFVEAEIKRLRLLITK